MRRLRKWFRVLGRRLPRVVSYDTMQHGRYMLPGTQRKLARAQRELFVLGQRYALEQERHRAKAADCESLKQRLSPEELKAWKAERRGVAQR